MQHLDNNMDDLFKRAGDNYPLKIAPGDWDKIAPLSQPAVPVVGANKKRPSSGFLLLVIILFISGGLLPLHTQDATSTNTGQNEILTGKKQAGKNTIARIIKTTGNKTKNVAGIPQAGIARQHSESNPLQNNMAASEKNVAANNYIDIHASLPELKLVNAVIHPIPEKITKENAIANNPVAAPIKLVQRKKASLYFKLDAGIQTSQVKAQGFIKPGLTIELLAGLQLNKKVAIETGIGWSKKYFFSRGQYFDMSKVSAGMPNNMVLKSLTSTSNIFEIPVSVVYQIKQKKSSAVFVSAGFNTFIYSGEHNDYLAMVNGIEQNIAGKYHTHKSYFSAAAELGIGYGFSIGPKSQLMIKPYVQIPLRNIGVGSVQLTTLGLRLGITRFSQH